MEFKKAAVSPPYAPSAPTPSTNRSFYAPSAPSYTPWNRDEPSAYTERGSGHEEASMADIDDLERDMAMEDAYDSDDTPSGRTRPLVSKPHLHPQRTGPFGYFKPEWEVDATRRPFY